MSTETMRDQALQEQANKGSKMIWVTFRKEGIHKYPAALDDPKLATGDEYDVSFLGHPHRHIFHFKVAIEVFHDDRDIEFIQFKRWMENMYADGTMKLDYKSCEMISDDLYMTITKRYPGRKIERNYMYVSIKMFCKITRRRIITAKTISTTKTDLNQFHSKSIKYYLGNNRS